MTLFSILLSTLIGGVVAVCIAYWLSTRVFAKYLHHMVSVSVGVLLAVALLHLLPEAFSEGISPRLLFSWMLASVVGYFVLEKIALLRHSHHHEGDGHHHHHGMDRTVAGKGGVLILIGSSLHNLVDGIVIAAAFLTDPTLGVLTATSIILHEVPHKLGDFVVLTNAGLTRQRAFLLILFSSACSALGGLFGYLLLEHALTSLPYILVVAATSFLYISIADLIPQMHARGSLKDAIPQLLLVAIGVIVVYLSTVLVDVH
ncbi:zinc and cadmium transporter [Jezberella montanilacus]|jgi:zinc and cadmium transporter|uniref:Zinc and cadmium transporter n=1 Tax=Jezberella montanilacus TaxID=323426 RepID=A0A2T0XDQ2_9BURK|nr:ZIP family metal transporter [Jezberella montanilacus]PRY97088.1 zinc and cadmium transporter [Jezberella montanilacus]